MPDEIELAKDEAWMVNIAERNRRLGESLAKSNLPESVSAKCRSWFPDKIVSEEDITSFEEFFQQLMHQWTITIQCGVGFWDVGGLIVRGYAGKKDCCDPENTCRHCSVPTEFDPVTGHGYSEFDTSYFDYWAADFVEIARQVYRLVNQIIPGKPRSHGRY